MRILLLGKGNILPRYSLVSVNCENWVGRDFYGHEVITFGYNEGVDIRIGVDDDFSSVVERLPEGWNPDFCLLWEIDWNLLPEGIEHAPFPTVAIAWDWDYDIPFATAIFEMTDFAVALGEFEKEAIRAVGANNVEVMYFIGVMKDYIPSSPKPVRERKYDILYTTWIDDVVLSDRSEWILDLCSLSGKYKICVDNPRLDYRDYNELLSDSRLVLSHHRYGSMSGRIIEAGAQGTVTLETGDEVNRHFKADEEYIPITRENFSERIERYLRDESALQDISAKVHRKVAEEFEAGKRFLLLLEFIERHLRGSKPARKYHALSAHEKCMKRGEIFYYAYFRTPTYITAGRDIMLRKSIEEFSRSVEMDPTPAAMINLAVAAETYEFAYRKNAILDSKGGEVVDILNRAIALHPKYALAYFHLGILHMRVRNFEEARTAFLKTLKLIEDPEGCVDPWCLYLNDFDKFPLRKTINKNLLALHRGNKAAVENIEKLYRAATEYYLSLIAEETGSAFEALGYLRKSLDDEGRSGLVARKTAELLSVLGMQEESRKMYRKAMELLPFNIDLRVDYIMLLYLSRRDREAIIEINRIGEMMNAVHSIRPKYELLKYTMESFGRGKGNLHLSHDSCNEKVLNNWVERLFAYLRKDPSDLRLVTRIIDIWKDLGRMDKILELLDGYIRYIRMHGTVDEKAISRLKGVLSGLQGMYDRRRAMNAGRLEKIEKAVMKRGEAVGGQIR